MKRQKINFWISNPENAKITEKIKFVDIDDNKRLKIYSKEKEKKEYLLSLKQKEFDKSGFMKIIESRTNPEDLLIICSSSLRYKEISRLNNETKNVVISSSFGRNAGANDGIDSMKSARKTIDADKSILISVTIYSDADHQNLLNVYGIENGKKTLITSVNLNVKNGKHSYTVRIQNTGDIKTDIFCAELFKDSLMYDNTYYFMAENYKNLDVLLIQPEQGDTDVTEYLLSSSGFKIRGKKREAAINDFNVTDKAPPDIFYFSNLKKINSEILTELKKYVKNGGNMILCPDGNSDFNLLNDYLGKQYSNEEPFLPVFLNSAAPPIFFKTSEDKILSKLFDYKITGAVNSKLYLESPAVTLLEFSDNTPAAVIKNYGKGKILVFLYSHKADENRFVLLPEYYYVFNGIIGNIFNSGNADYNDNTRKFEGYNELFREELGMNLKQGIYMDKEKKSYSFVNLRRPDLNENTEKIGDILKKLTIKKRKNEFSSYLIGFLIFLVLADSIFELLRR